MYEIFEQLLTDNNVTAYRVAKETGIAPATLSNWKTGVSTPKSEKLQKIADFFHVSLEYLTTGKEQSPTFKVLDLESSKIIDTLNNKELSKDNVHRLFNYMEGLKQIQNDEDYLKVQAAHMKKNATQYEIEHDNDIMKDDSNWE